MQTIRTARNAAAYFKSRDPDSEVSEWLIRRLMDNGDIPVIRNGAKRLTSIEAIEDYISTHLGGTAE